MEKLELKINDAARALTTLREIVDEPYSVIVRDAAIQRFEYSFEIFWKLIKEYLKTREGIICNSPKSCFKEAFKTELLTEEETMDALLMTDDRNLTTHTYHEEIADEIYHSIREYCKLMSVVHQRIVDL